MRKWIPRILLAVLIVLLLTAAAPQAAGTLKLKVNNKTGVNVSLSLSGPESYFFPLGPGNTTVEVAAGEYDYSYFACGQENTGKVKVKSNNTKFTLAECENAAGAASEETVKFVFDNKTGVTVNLLISSPVYRLIPLPTGKTRMDLTKGTYEYSYFACNENIADKFTVKKNNDKLVLPKCADEKTAGNNSATQLTIVNRTGETFRIVLEGPQTYYFNLADGREKFDVVAGKYDYTYTACGGEQQTGSVTVKKNGTTLKLQCPKESKANLGKVRVQNDTGGILYVTLDGPEYYTFAFPPGRTVIEVVRGRYEYTLFGCGGGTATGFENFGGNTNWEWYCAN